MMEPCMYTWHTDDKDKYIYEDSLLILRGGRISQFLSSPGSWELHTDA